jgi:hypothetical protein
VALPLKPTTLAGKGANSTNIAVSFVRKPHKELMPLLKNEHASQKGRRYLQQAVRRFIAVAIFPNCISDFVPQ